MTAQAPELSTPELLEVIAGERCPCGHLGENHIEATQHELTGLVEKWGECLICPCAGVLEFEDDDAADA